LDFLQNAVGPAAVFIVVVESLNGLKVFMVEQREHRIVTACRTFATQGTVTPDERKSTRFDSVRFRLFVSVKVPSGYPFALIKPVGAGHWLASKHRDARFHGRVEWTHIVLALPLPD
jgi:hypothetical protein